MSLTRGKKDNRMANSLYDNHNKVLPWWRQAGSQHLKAWLANKAASQVGVLSSSSDVWELGRSQGRLEIINELLNLENHLETHARKVRSGEVKTTERKV